MLSFTNYLLLEMPMQTGANLALVQESNLYVLFESNHNLQVALRKRVLEAIDQSIYGILRIRDNTLYNADEVDAIWAHKGYGPLMYLIGMQNAGKRGLMSSRVSNQVTSQAKEVWRQFYQGAGKDLVLPVPLQAKHHHEEEWLSYKYVLRKPYDITKLLNKGKIALKNDPYNEKLNLIIEAADALLSRHMSDIYNP
jgi:hypothetical protein